MDEQLVSTPVGTARLDLFPTQGRQRATVVLGHGTATGVEATDLQALAQALPPLGIAVVLMTQPYRVKRNPRVADEASLDRAWTAPAPEPPRPPEPPKRNRKEIAGIAVAVVLAVADDPVRLPRPAGGRQRFRPAEQQGRAPIGQLRVLDKRCPKQHLSA